MKNASMNWRRTGVLLTAAAATALAACGDSGPTRAELVTEFESVGFTGETAECLVANLEDQGYEIEAMTGELDAEVEAALDTAVAVCVGLTREEAVAEFQSAGFTGETAECMVAYLEDQGFDADVLLGEVDADLEVGIDMAVQSCLSAGDLGGLIGGSDEIRTEFIAGMTESGVISPEQAECVVDRLQADGTDIAELFAADDFDAQMDEAFSGCP